MTETPLFDGYEPPERPKRIQRKRTRGWRMPPDAVYVGRPSKWGNPFAVGDPHPTIGQPMGRQDVVDAFRFEIECAEAFRTEGAIYSLIRRELAGKDLACWCPLVSHGVYVPCHADVLLELANRETT